MSTHHEDDAFWAEALQRAGVPRDLDAAATERMLDEAGDAPLDTAWIDAVVRSATSQQVETDTAPPAVAPVVHLHTRRRSPVRRVAVVAAMLLAAAVVSRLLVWPEATHSRDTMNYAQAVLLLGMADQPEESRSIGLATVFAHVQQGSRTLAQVRDAAPADALGQLAAQRLAALRDMLVADPASFAPSPATDDLDTWCRTALDAGRDAAVRSKALEEVARLAALGILSIRTMQAPTPLQQEELTIVLGRLQRELAR